MRRRLPFCVYDLGCRTPRSLPARFRPRSLRDGGLSDCTARDTAIVVACRIRSFTENCKTASDARLISIRIGSALHHSRVAERQAGELRSPDVRQHRVSQNDRTQEPQASGQRRLEKQRLLHPSAAASVSRSLYKLHQKIRLTMKSTTSDRLLRPRPTILGVQSPLSTSRLCLRDSSRILPTTESQFPAEDSN
jgi:hypothetical protein